jgi:hypothetical protein
MQLRKRRNVVLVHRLFADGFCSSEVIARLQTPGLNVTSVQNPLTALPEAVTSAEPCWRGRTGRQFWSGIPS